MEYWQLENIQLWPSSVVVVAAAVAAAAAVVVDTCWFAVGQEQGSACGKPQKVSCLYHSFGTESLQSEKNNN